MHYLEDLNIDALALVFRVHRATIARRLIALRERVFDQVRAHVALDLDARSSEALSLVRLLRSEIAVSVSRILK
jgi:RNA polymerase sigma-70 factor (ECF subfamily)